MFWVPIGLIFSA